MYFTQTNNMLNESYGIVLVFLRAKKNIVLIQISVLVLKTMFVLWTNFISLREDKSSCNLKINMRGLISASSETTRMILIKFWYPYSTDWAQYLQQTVFFLRLKPCILEQRSFLEKNVLNLLNILNLSATYDHIFIHNKNFFYRIASVL